MRHARQLLIVAAVAVVLSVIFSGPSFITPRYRSSAIAFPVNLNKYSIETPTDQLLQLLESNSIRDSVIARFGLMEHYEVDTTTRGGYFALYNTWKERVEVSKTRLESVQIEVTDEDPRMARDIVHEMLRQLDLLARRLQREKSHEVLVIAERDLLRERQKLDSVEARLDTLRREAGLLSYDYQARELTRGLVRMMQSGAPASRVDEVRSMIRELEEKGGEFRQLTELSDLFRTNYDRRRTAYDEVLTDVTKELTYTNVVVYPEVSDKKVFPVRWLIVLLVTASSTFLAFVYFAWRDPR